MDLNAIRQRLADLENSSTKKTGLWKPKPGKHQIRIVPYLYNKSNPFIELYFYYNFGMKKKTILSPSSFGRPDPIFETSNKLKTTGVKDDWILGKKIEPKLRTFVPIIVRGAENEGVKFWGFGKETYQQLLTYISDPDYGDISDIKSGRDIVVEVISAEQAGNSYGSVKILVKPNPTPITLDKDLLKSILENQKEITTVYTEPTYESLEKELEDWLNGPTDSEPAAEVDNDLVGVETKTSTPKKAAPKVKAQTVPGTTRDIDSALEDLFDKKD